MKRLFSTQDISFNDEWFVGFCDGSKNDKLVLWGSNLSSSVGKPRYTQLIMEMICLPAHFKSIIIGLLLSDGWISFPNPYAKNARLGFEQSLAHFGYFWDVFLDLSHYCSSLPHYRGRSRFGKNTYGMGLFSRSLPCMTRAEVYTLFYKDGKKIVPIDIYNLLTPSRALAHWIQGDGQAKSHGLIICTNSYSIEEVVRLMNVLIIRYGIDCTLHSKKRNQKIEYLIYIRQDSMPLLRSIVSPYMSESMRYKIYKS